MYGIFVLLQIEIYRNTIKKLTNKTAYYIERDNLLFNIKNQLTLTLRKVVILVLKYTKRLFKVYNGSVYE